MKNERFVIRAYGKSELAMLYFPIHSQRAAMRLFTRWLKVNPKLRTIPNRKKYFYTPKEVRMILEEIGEPYDTE